MAEDTPMHHGSCLCGAVRLDVHGPLSAPDACHCSDCRKWSGHYFVSTNVAREALTIHGESHLTWFTMSEKVRRGFCKTCGTCVFWDPIHHDWTAIAMGIFDTPTGTAVSKHIWVVDKGDYYEITDDLPQNSH